MALPELIRQMMEPQFYPHAVKEPIRLVQTHISWVLLTGSFAYKVKKPMNFGFLDFTTPQKRAHFCREELRLNRRFAPELYLAVLPLGRDAGQSWRFCDEARAEDYTLKMREFPQDALWRQCFEAGTLTTQMMARLGRLLAGIHKDAPAGPEIAHFGDIEEVRQVISDNYGASRSFLDNLQTRDQLDQTSAFTRSFLATHKDLLCHRRDNGFIKECHGDLHLNNICNYNNDIHIFDCIEFNREFRCIDPIYDVAFLMVDLLVRDRRDFAYAFFNAWLEWSGDYDGACLLPLYCSMRAYVRAKIYSFQTVDEQIADQERSLAAEKAKHFYRQAWQCTQAENQNIWVVCGLSGSGKSTVATYLAQMMGAVHIKSDALRKHMVGIAPDRAAPAAAYETSMSRRVYEKMTELAVRLAREGVSVVLDAKYDRKSLRRSLTKAANKWDIQASFIWCCASKDVLEQRLRERTGDVSDATPALIPQQLRHQQPIEASENLTWLELNTEKNWAQVLRQKIKT